MEPLLSVVTITYNHEPYVAKTIEGVLMQKVDFPIEYIIAEDHSTDGTLAICKRYAEKYPDLIKLIYSDSNVGAIANERRAMKAARGKYIAFCEGDDYWTDSLKLQKQVDFMEANPEYSVCFHRCIQHDTVSLIDTSDCSESFFLNNKVESSDVSVEMYLKCQVSLLPLTMVYRNNIITNEIMEQYKFYRDTHQIYHLLCAGKGCLFSFIGAVRNLHSGGIFNSLKEEEYHMLSCAISKEMLYYNDTDSLLKQIAITDCQCAYSFFCRKNDRMKAVIYAFKSFRLSKHFVFFVKQVLIAIWR